LLGSHRKTILFFLTICQMPMQNHRNLFVLDATSEPVARWGDVRDSRAASLAPSREGIQKKTLKYLHEKWFQLPDSTSPGPRFLPLIQCGEPMFFAACTSGGASWLAGSSKASPTNLRPKRSKFKPWIFILQASDPNYFNLDSFAKFISFASSFIIFPHEKSTGDACGPSLDRATLGADTGSAATGPRPGT
jgi:hypothetical protein